jgi:TonB family protein
MDASTRSFHVYGKTESGAGALKAGRDGMSTSARRLLILVDGQRTVGELAAMLGVDAVEMGLAQLETMGCVEFLRRFPGADEALTEVPASPDPEMAPATVLPLATEIDLPADGADLPLPKTWQAAVEQAQAPELPAPPRRRAAPVRVGTAVIVGVALIVGAGWVWYKGVLSPVGSEAVTALRAERVPPAAPSLPLAPPAPAPVRSVAPAGALRLAPPPATAGDAPVVRPAAGSSLRVRTQVTPAIPRPVLDRGITSGHVVVVLHVDPAGTVQRVELVSANPPEVYDAAMAQAFANWTFDPLGIPGRMTVDVDIRPPK